MLSPRADDGIDEKKLYSVCVCAYFNTKTGFLRVKILQCKSYQSHLLSNDNSAVGDPGKGEVRTRKGRVRTREMGNF